MLDNSHVVLLILILLIEHKSIINNHFYDYSISIYSWFHCLVTKEFSLAEHIWCFNVSQNVSKCVHSHLFLIKIKLQTSFSLRRHWDYITSFRC